MKKFKFRLEKVLEYRELEEKWAKDAVLAAKLEILHKELELEQIASDRQKVLSKDATTVEARMTLQTELEQSDEMERQANVQLAVLRDEENAAIEVWKAKRRDLQALISLRDEAEAAWRAEADRKEQIDLDEWASMRRAS